ncbi:MAG: endonuclease/exonuclease/phosphatase family protein [Lachnospiraceae bacterium]|nr:endonuclease/exonuclease/phosphatase family protein [Lachnospiraceae bacterium]
MNKNHLVKSILKSVGIVFGVCLTLFVCYVAYVFITYERIPDKQVLEVSHSSDLVATTGETYGIVSYNLGFGAYLPDFSFFMDGGEKSIAKSKESVIYAIQGAAKAVKDLNPDFVTFQEVDLDGTRSHHVNQFELLCQNFESFDNTYAVNFDSAFLAYPILEPHGKNKACIATFSRFGIESALRRSLPITTSVTKVLDLDRCYSVSRIPVEGGKYLCIFNIHMSAYSSDASIREGQIKMFAEDMAKEYAAGNYVICAGDFNHDLKNMNFDEEPAFSWAYPFPRDLLPEGFAFAIDELQGEEAQGLWDSARNADIEYIPGETMTITLDGFIFSDNIEMVNYTNLNLGYAYSDHDPVYMEFILK